jgi:HAD superfamily hydrolase (TIGR01549 family)
MIKAIIFDLDGVIIESVDIKTKAFRKLFEQAYPEKTDAIVKYHIQNMGISRYVKFKHIYKNILRLPLSTQQEEELGRKFSNIVLDEVLNAPFVNGAIEFLKANYKKYSFFVASGTPRQELNYIIKKRGLFDYFKGIYGSPASKTEIILNIISSNVYYQNEVVFIGDSITDLKAAQETGVYFIARVNSESKELVNCQNRVENFKMIDASLVSL